MQDPNTEPTKQTVNTPPPSSGQAPTLRTRIRRFGLPIIFFAALMLSATASHLFLSRLEYQKVADVVADLNQSAGQILEEFELSLSHLGHYVGDTVQKLELEGELAHISRFDRGTSNLIFDTVRGQLGNMRALGALVQEQDGTLDAIFGEEDFTRLTNSRLEDITSTLSDFQPPRRIPDTKLTVIAFSAPLTLPEQGSKLLTFYFSVDRVFKQLSGLSLISSSARAYLTDDAGDLLTEVVWEEDDARQVVEVGAPMALAGMDPLPHPVHGNQASAFSAVGPTGKELIAFRCVHPTLGVTLTVQVDRAEVLADFFVLRQAVWFGNLLLCVVAAIALRLAVLRSRRAVKSLTARVAEQDEELRRLSLAVIESPLSIFITDANGVIQYANEQFRATTGFSPDEAIGQTPAILRSGETPSDQISTLWQTILSGRVYHGEIRNRRADGEFYWARLAIAPAMDAAGAPSHFIAMVQDITAERETLAALDRAQVERTLALEGAQVGLWSVDLKADAWTFDTRAAALVALAEPSQPLALSTWTAPLTRSSRRALAETIYGLGAHADEFELELTLQRPEAQERFVLIRGRARPDAGAGKRIFDGVVQDITQRRQAEKQLAAREENFRTLVSTIPGTVFRCDIDSQWNMRYISDEVLRLTGYPASDFLLSHIRSFASVIHPADRKEVEKVIANAVDENAPYTVEYRIIDRSGNVRSVFERGMAFYDDSNAPRGLVGTILDITTRKQTELALQKSDERYALVVEGARDALWDYQIENDKLYLSPRFYTLIAEQGEDKNLDLSGLYELVHPRDRKRLMEAVRRCSEGHDPHFENEFRIQRAQGETLWLLMRGAHSTNTSGQIVRMAGTLSDITERKEIELNLYRERTQLQMILDTSPIAVAITEADEIQFANPAFNQTFELGPGESIAGAFQNEPARIELMQKLAEERRIGGIEWQVSSAHGRKRDVLAYFSAVTFHGRESVLSWMMDITDRKASERRVQESEARLEAAARAGNLGLWELNTETNEILVHQNLAEMLGDVDLSEDAQKPKWAQLEGGLSRWLALIHPDDRERVLCGLRAHLAGETQNFYLELRKHLADGGFSWVLFSGRLLPEAPGQARKMVGVLLEINELKALQSALEQAKLAAEQATEAKSSFLANMSHEIRTPMNAIIGMSHLALQKEDRPNQKSYLSKIHHSAEALLGIVNDILDFSKIEAGKLAIEQTEFALETLFQDLAEITALRAAEKEQALIFRISQNLPARLQSDPLRLGQILQNLVSNAIKFTPIGGQIIVRAGLEERLGHKLLLHLSVTDNGIGLRPEQQSSLFEAFNQADYSTTRRFGGTGLGLTICRRLVELMGGRIWVESEVDRGSTFHATIWVETPRLDVERVIMPSPSFAGKRALIVNGNAQFCAATAEMLSALGLEVQHATTAEQARALCKTMVSVDSDDTATDAGPPYDFILVDEQLDAAESGRLGTSLMTLDSRHHGPDTQDDGQDNGDDGAAQDPSGQPSRVPASGERPSDSAGQVARSDGDESADEPSGRVRQPAIFLLSEPNSDLLQETAVLYPLAGQLFKPLTPGYLRDRLLQRFDDDLHPTRANSHTLDVTRSVLGGKQVLIVEDNEINQELVLELLQTADIHCAVANNGVEALAILEKRRFDCVLMDCQMPVMDGLETTRRIKRDPRLQALPVVAMSADVMESARQNAFAAGVDAFIAKPIDVDVLYETLMARIAAPGVGKSRATDNAAAEISDAKPARPQSDNGGTPGPDTRANTGTSTSNPPPARPNATQPENRIEVLSKIPGLDAAQGLRTANHNHNLYARLLEKFIPTARYFTDAYRTLIGNEDFTAARRLVHNLKGTAANLGLTELTDLTRALEDATDAVAAPARIEAALRDVSASLARMVDALTSAGFGNVRDFDITQMVNIEDADIELAACGETLKTLESLLLEDDMTATKYVKALDGLMQIAELRKPLRKLNAACESFAFEEALGHIQEIKSLIAGKTAAAETTQEAPGT